MPADWWIAVHREHVATATVTLAWLDQEGCDVIFECVKCRNTQRHATGVLIVLYGPETTLGGLSKRLRCTGKDAWPPLTGACGAPGLAMPSCPHYAIGGATPASSLRLGEDYYRAMGFETPTDNNAPAKRLDPQG